MKLFGNGWQVGTSLAVGAGIVLLAPIVMPMVAGVMKPLVKAVIKGGLLAYENGKVALAETKETLDDLAAEAKSEIAAAHKHGK